MGGKKFEISRLTNIRKQIVGALKDNDYFTNDDKKFSCQLCVDWDEFNKLYFSKRHSVIQCHVISNSTKTAFNTISLYIAMKMAFDLKKVIVITDNFTSLEYQINEFYKAIDPTKDIDGRNGRLNTFSAYSIKLSSILDCDEIVVPYSNVLTKPLNVIIDFTLNVLSEHKRSDVKLTILAPDIKVNDDDDGVLYNGLYMNFDKEYSSSLKIFKIF